MTQGWPEWLQINDNLRDLSPYGAPQIDSPVRLNTNENPYNLDPTLQASIVAAISKTSLTSIAIPIVMQ